MGKITEVEFESIIYSKDYSISNCRIEFDEITNFDLGKINSKFIFDNVVFAGKRFSFYKNIEKHLNYITFKNCTFLTDLYIGNCDFQNLHFISNVFKCQYIIIRGCKILEIKCIDTNIFENGSLKINLSEIGNLDIENVIFHRHSKLELIESNFNETVSIIRCNINQILFSHCNFKSHFEYFGNKITTSAIDSAFFNHCIFNHSSFFETTFNSDTKFSDCKFLNETKFESLDSEIFSVIKFTDCEFFKSTTFNRAVIHQLSFEKVNFINEISFQETYFDIIKIDRTIFEKGALFDDIQIKKIDDCDRRTIRTIKQELQKKENKIDYNRFRVYEFNAYRKDIKKQLIEFKNDKNGFRHRKRQPQQLKRDLFILNVSDLVSEYGTDWKRAIKFTILSGFAAFTLFFILENLDKSFNLSNWEDFVYGYFRFFLITDFKNEYYEAGESVLKFNCFISLVPFIIGKIAVAFGLYEMIQSFRKFKA